MRSYPRVSSAKRAVLCNASYSFCGSFGIVVMVVQIKEYLFRASCDGSPVCMYRVCYFLHRPELFSSSPIRDLIVFAMSEYRMGYAGVSSRQCFCLCVLSRSFGSSDRFFDS